jgi:hypothetical protein
MVVWISNWRIAGQYAVVRPFTPKTAEEHSQPKCRTASIMHYMPWVSETTRGKLVDRDVNSVFEMMLEREIDKALQRR